jgi:hypothetical protein
MSTVKLCEQVNVRYETDVVVVGGGVAGAAAAIAAAPAAVTSITPVVAFIFTSLPFISYYGKSDFKLYSHIVVF